MVMFCYFTKFQRITPHDTIILQPFFANKKKNAMGFFFMDDIGTYELRNQECIVVKIFLVSFLSHHTYD